MPSNTHPSALRAARIAAGYRTAKEFAEEVGITEPTYTRYERRPDLVPTTRAWAIADALGVPIDVVVGRVACPSAVLGPTDPYGDRIRALDESGRRLIDEWLDLLERAGRSRLFPEGRR